MKALYIISGCLCVGLALAGLALPLLPTTPFLLLAAWCFFRGSPRLYKTLIEHPKLGRHIIQYQQNRCIPKGAQKRAIIILWIGLNASAILWMKLVYLPLILMAVGVAVTAHIVSFKTSD